MPAIERSIQVGYPLRVHFTENAFAPENPVLRSVLDSDQRAAKALLVLDEALAMPKNPIVRDSAIQRFEISFELCWKFLKAYLRRTA